MTNNTPGCTVHRSKTDFVAKARSHIFSSLLPRFMRGSSKPSQCIQKGWTFDLRNSLHLVVSGCGTVIMDDTIIRNARFKAQKLKNNAFECGCVLIITFLCWVSVYGLIGRRRNQRISRRGYVGWLNWDHVCRPLFSGTEPCHLRLFCKRLQPDLISIYSRLSLPWFKLFFPSTMNGPPPAS